MKKTALAVFSYIMMAVVAAALTVWPHIFSITGAEMDYAVIAWIIVFPLTSLIFTFIAGLRGVLYGLLATFLAAAGSLVMPLVVFGATGREYMLVPVVASVLGLAASLAIARMLGRKED